MSNQWFTEKHTPHCGLTWEYSERLYDAHSGIQRVEVLETLEYGRMLLLDGFVMLTQRDEFIYHEMIAHVPLFTHGAVRDVLIVGGGDGGTLRECLRHRDIRSVTLVEIDSTVIEVSRKYFPELSAGMDDPRAAILIGDGFDHLRETGQSYDAIIVDSIDPVGEAAKLFTAEFYQLVKQALRPGGVAAFQTESPFLNLHVLQNTIALLSNLFNHASPFLAHIPTYPSGFWSFAYASDALVPPVSEPEFRSDIMHRLRYFTPELYPTAFVLPKYIADGIRTDPAGAD